MKPIYNSATGATKRPRIRKRNIGEYPRGLKEQAQAYGISKLSTGLLLLSIGVEVVNLNLR